MIHDVEALFRSIKGPWSIIRLPNLDLLKPTLMYEMDCSDDPFYEVICTEQYVDAILAYLCCKDFNTFCDENDGHWLKNPDIQRHFLMDAMYFSKANPAFRFIAHVHVLVGGDIILEY